MLFATLFNAGPTTIIDHIAKHLLVTQRGVAAADTGGACRYHMHVDDNLLMCAAGCMFDDADYASLHHKYQGVSVPGAEGLSFYDLGSDDIVLDAMISSDGLARQLIIAVQEIHDAYATNRKVYAEAERLWGVNVANLPSPVEIRARLWLGRLRGLALKRGLVDAWVLTDEAYQAVYGYAEVK